MPSLFFNAVVREHSSTMSKIDNLVGKLDELGYDHVTEVIFESESRNIYDLLGRTLRNLYDYLELLEDLLYCDSEDLITNQSDFVKIAQELSCL